MSVANTQTVRTFSKVCWLRVHIEKEDMILLRVLTALFGITLSYFITSHILKVDHTSKNILCVTFKISIRDDI